MQVLRTKTLLSLHLPHLQHLSGARRCFKANVTSLLFTHSFLYRPSLEAFADRAAIPRRTRRPLSSPYQNCKYKDNRTITAQPESSPYPPSKVLIGITTSYCNSSPRLLYLPRVAHSPLFTVTPSSPNLQIMPSAYAVKDGGDARSKKQSMADLKLRRLQELNTRLKEDLERPRVKVAEASTRYYDFFNFKNNSTNNRPA